MVSVSATTVIVVGLGTSRQARAESVIDDFKLNTDVVYMPSGCQLIG